MISLSDSAHRGRCPRRLPKRLAPRLRVTIHAFLLLCMWHCSHVTVKTKHDVAKKIRKRLLALRHPRAGGDPALILTHKPKCKSALVCFSAFLDALALNTLTTKHAVGTSLYCHSNSQNTKSPEKEAYPPPSHFHQRASLDSRLRGNDGGHGGRNYANGYDYRLDGSLAIAHRESLFQHRPVFAARHTSPQDPPTTTRGSHSSLGEWPWAPCDTPPPPTLNRCQNASSNMPNTLCPPARCNGGQTNHPPSCHDCEPTRLSL